MSEHSERYKTYYVLIGKFFKLKRAETNYSIQDVADIIRRPKTIQLKSPNDQIYDFVFQLGSGTFYVR